MKDFNLDTNPKIKSGFKIPDQYFEQLETKIIAKVEQKETRVVSIFHKKQLWISSIAAVLLVMIAFPIYLNMAKSKATIETSSLESYLSTEFSTYELVDKLSDDDISTLENSITLNNDAVEAYLLETQNLDYYLNE